MKKLDLGQIISIFANIGVVAGIVFLAFELQQNTEVVRLNASQYLASEHAALNRFWAEPEIARIRVKVQSQGLENLTAQERLQYTGMLTSFLQLQHHLFYLYRAGSLEEGIWNGRHRLLVDMFDTEWVRTIWNEWGYVTGDEFRSYIDEVVIPEALGSLSK